MINTMEQALQPFSVAAFILGFGILRYPSNRPRFCLSFFYILIIWSVYIYVLYIVVNYFSPRSIFHGVLDIFVMVINILITIITIITNFLKYKKLLMCTRKLSFVDNTLEVLGTAKEYHGIQNSLKWLFVMWIIIIFTTWFITSLWYIAKYNDIRATFIPIIKDYPLYINILMDIMYMFHLRCVGTRLDNINNYIEELSKTEEYGLRCKWKKSLVIIRPHMHAAGNRKRVLWIAMHLHSELCRIASGIHDLYQIHMTLQMICYFVIFIAMIYFKYHTMLCLKEIYGGDTIRLKLLVYNDIWFVICFIKLISFNHICESVSDRAKKTQNVVYKLTNLIYFTEAREEISQFVLQISLRPLKFSGLGLFYFGYKFVRKFSTWILTAVIFILQMDTSPISQIISLERNNMTCY